jgi:hypothetical protein
MQLKPKGGNSMHLNPQTHKITIRGSLKIKTRTVRKIKTATAGCIWITGLLIAGSDSPYMPWLNGLGILMFSGISLISGQWLSRLDSSGSGKVIKTPPSRSEKTRCAGWKKPGWGMNSPWPGEYVSDGDDKIHGRIFSKI